MSRKIAEISCVYTTVWEGKKRVCVREREREREEKAVQFLPVEIVGVKKLELCLALFSRL